jgi:hypothetical protein
MKQLRRAAMKFVIFALIGLVSVTATCTMYGWLESTMNMVEGLGQLFAPGATTVIFSPFLLLFILLTLGVFVLVSLLTVAIAAVLGGSVLRFDARPVSRSFTRSFVLVTVIFQFAVILFSAGQDASFLLRRPGVHPVTPDSVMALLASANAALNLFVAALIVRKLTDKQDRLSRQTVVPI